MYVSDKYIKELEHQIEEMHQKLVESERNAFVFRKIAEYVIVNSTVTYHIDLGTNEKTGGFSVKAFFNVRVEDLKASDEYPEARRFFDQLHEKANPPPDEDSVPF